MDSCSYCLYEGRMVRWNKRLFRFVCLVDFLLLIKTRLSEVIQIAQKLFGSDLRNHLYCEIPDDVRLRRYPHTLVGQAHFMRDVIRKFRRQPFVCGAMVYCYSDCLACYCGQPDCPVENLWGLVDLNGQRKPAWYAVRDAFSECSSK